MNDHPNRQATLSEIEVRLAREPENEDLPLPSYQTAGSAGLDLRAAVREEITLQPGEIRDVPTGIRVAVPVGYEAQVRPRSGLALREGLGVANAPGTIDSDYRGELRVILINLGSKRVVIRRGDRVAQLVISPVARARLREVEHLDHTERGSGGFGHTGV